MTDTLRTLLAAASLTAIAGLAFGSETPDGYGIPTPSGSTFTTAIGNAADCDDYVFDGYAGMTVDAKVKRLKNENLVPFIDLVRPDGTILTPDKAKEKSSSFSLKGTLDQTGVWKVRVRRNATSDLNAYGFYSVTVKYNGPKFAKDKTTIADPATAQFIYSVPGTAGALVDFTFKFKGGDPSFAFFTDGAGAPIEAADGSITDKTKKIVGKKLLIPEGTEPGNYALGFDDDLDSPITKVSFKLKVKLPKGEKKVKATLSSFEPLLIGQTFPSIGGPSTKLFVTTKNGIDVNDLDGVPTITVGGEAIVDLEVRQDPTDPTVHTWSGIVPGTIDEAIGGMHDVAFRTSTGQTVVALNAFERVLPPVVTAISQPAGTTRGGFELKIIGDGFNDSKDTASQFNMTVTIDGQDTIIVPTDVTPSVVTFTSPSWPAGSVTYGVKDKESLLSDQLGLGTFEYLATAQITRVTPNLSPTLGGELISVVGVEFTAMDTLFLEKEDGSFEVIPNTFVDDQRHQFTAPPRSKGSYEVYVTDPQGQRTTGEFLVSYFTFADFTAQTGLNAQITQDEVFDADSTFVSDLNQDGFDDLLLSFVGGDNLASSSQTRILQNNGDGSFTDVTLATMPAVTNNDDWRADRVWAANLDSDDYPEILIATNSTKFPQTNRSHVRVLRNAGQPGQPQHVRQFIEITDDVMPAVRVKSPFSFTGGNESVADNWRALDMFVGDIDNSGGVPDIVIVHDEISDEPNTNCGNYCSSPLGSSATYNFYWGGSRRFRWDAGLNGGAGGFDFDEDFFPRKSGVGVQIAIPGGGTIVGCSVPCRGKFTPFIGQKLAVGAIDTDAKPDFAILSSGLVTREGQTISSLQIALNKPNNAEGSGVTDVTAKVTGVGGDWTGQAIAIGQPFSVFGTIAVSKSELGGSRALRLLQAEQSGVQGELINFRDVSSQKLPGTTADEHWQASAMAFTDTNGDRLQDLVLVANAPIGTDGLAFRILRAVVQGGEVLYNDSFKGLLAPIGATDLFDGSSLLVTDINNDDAPEYIVTRSVKNGDQETQTRTITTDKE